MINYFEIFEIKEEFDIDLDLLEEKYHDFQRNFHPDKAGIAEIEKSIALNDGFKVLSDPLLRAAHILKLNGIDVNNDSKAPKVDMAVLQQIMELQEEIMEGSDEEKARLKSDLKNMLDEANDNTKGLLSERKFADAAQSLMKARYLKKTLSDLKKLS